MAHAGVEIQKLTVHADGRGAVFEPLEPALVRYRSGDTIEERHVPAGKAWRFAFPPGTAHAFKNSGSGPMVLVSFNTEQHDPLLADAVREELIGP
jgi:hypothetical protein